MIHWITKFAFRREPAERLPAVAFHRTATYCRALRRGAFEDGTTAVMAESRIIGTQVKAWDRLRASSAVASSGTRALDAPVPGLRP